MILMIAIFGCSIKGTIELVEAERAYDVAEERSLKKVDVFNWTMADAYIKKAREEYSNSNYETAAVLARKCKTTLEKIQPPVDSSEMPPKQPATPKQKSDKTSGEK